MTSMRRTLTLVLAAGALALAGCEDELTVPDFNNPSLEDLETNPTRSLVTTAAQGLLIGARAQMGARNGYVSLLGILGRESYNFDGSDPRFITEMLDGALDPGSPAFGANLWGQRYANVRNAHLVLNALELVQGFTPAELAAIRGFAETIRAHDLLLVINTRDSNGAVIDTDRPVGDDPAPIESRDVVLAHISERLDAAAAQLDAAGGSFPFALSTGFDGFDTPAEFREFNRALKARVEVYRGNHQAALDALDESFIDTTEPLDLGVYHVYGTGAGDVVNALYDPGDTPDILAHPLIVQTAERKADNSLDDRIAEKIRDIDSRTRLGITTDKAFDIYTSASASIPWIRNEELILLRAEAEIGTGAIPAAAADLNFIRVNSGGLPPRVDLTAANIEDELLRQRHLSLLFEGGHRWIDMRRFGRLDELPRDLASHRVNERFPIPEAEQLARQGG